MAGIDRLRHFRPQARTRQLRLAGRRWGRHWGICLAAALASTLCGNAFGAFGAHYLGFSRDRAEFRLYLDGGEFLGQQGAYKAIKVAVHQIPRGRPLRAVAGCVYRFDDTDRRRDRIDCAENPGSPLSGVAYTSGEDGSLVCVQRCGPRVPLRLHLEDADEDNG